MVQVNGKLRAHIQAPAGVTRETLEQLALADEHVRRFTDGKTLRKLIHVPNKLINIVVS